MSIFKIFACCSLGETASKRLSRGAAYAAVHDPLGWSSKVSPSVASPRTGAELNILACQEEPVRIARLCSRLRPTQHHEQILRHESRDLDWYSSLVLLFRIVEGSKNRAGESALGG